MSVLPPNYVQAWVEFTTATVPRSMFTQLAYSVATPPYDQGDADALIAAMAAILDNVVSADVSIPGGFVLVGQDGGSQRFDVVLGTPEVGDRAGSMSPPQVTLLLKKVTAVGGRRGRGRMFIPGPSESDTTQNGKLAAALQTALGVAGTALANLPGATPAANVALAVLLHDTAPTFPTSITAIQGSNFVATQRRRLVRGTT